MTQLGPLVREASNSGVSTALSDLDSPQRHTRIPANQDDPPPPPDDVPDDSVDNAGSGSAAAKKPRQTMVGGPTASQHGAQWRVRLRR